MPIFLAVAVQSVSHTENSYQIFSPSVSHGNLVENASRPKRISQLVMFHFSADQSGLRATMSYKSIVWGFKGYIRRISPTSVNCVAVFPDPTVHVHVAKMVQDFLDFVTYLPEYQQVEDPKFVLANDCEYWKTPFKCHKVRPNVLRAIGDPSRYSEDPEDAVSSRSHADHEY